MLHVAAAGFQHETNSFAPQGTGYDRFEMADSWPGLTRGDALWDVMPGLNIPLGGFLNAARHAGDIRVTPLLWASAEPAGLVTQDAFDRIAAELLDRLAAAGPVDALYVDLHGAMIAQHAPDGEAELLARLRAQVGPDLPIVVSLDLHANISPALARLATRIAIFRTYPHLDMGATGARCLPLIRDMLDGPAPSHVLVHADYLVPMAAQWTGAEPSRGLYAAAEAEGAELSMGFPAGDMAWAGPAALVYAETPAAAEARAEAWRARFASAEPVFAARAPMTPAAAMQAALSAPHGPVVIADVADNPGGGGTSDTMGMMHAAIAAGATGTVFFNIWAPDVALQAHAAGVGGRLQVALGARTGWPGDAPVDTPLIVEALSQGPVRYLGEMYGGGMAEVGPSALVRLDQPGCDIRAVLTTIPNQALDRGFLTHFGLEPAAQRVIVLKSSVHYRADFAPIATRIIEASAPGRLPADLHDLPFQHLRPGLHRMPRAAAAAAR